MIKRSKATQLTFWMNNQATFNEQREGGIDHRCFNPLFCSDDTLTDQFIDDALGAGVTYKLQCLNKAGIQLALIDYVHPGAGVHKIDAGSSFRDYGIIKSWVRFKMLRYVDAVLDEDFISPITDFYDIKPVHRDSRLLTYTNDKDYAGIVYTDNTPVFNIRFKCRFYKERNPTEEEAESLSDGTVEKLSSSMKSQKRLDVEPVAPYFHTLINLALQHTTASINNINYLKEEPYTLKELNDRYPFDAGECWLTPVEDNFVTNV